MAFNAFSNTFRQSLGAIAIQKTKAKAQESIMKRGIQQDTKTQVAIENRLKSIDEAISRRKQNQRMIKYHQTIADRQAKQGKDNNIQLGKVKNFQKEYNKNTKAIETNIKKGVLEGGNNKNNKQDT